MRVHSTAMVFLAALVVLPSEACAQSVAPTATTVCQLLENPQQFNGKYVKFSARADTPDGIKVVFIDEHCLPRGVWWGESEPGSHRAALDDLWSTVQKTSLGNIGNKGKHDQAIVVATISGYFVGN
jgi:hypothetical protein